MPQKYAWISYRLLNFYASGVISKILWLTIFIGEWIFWLFSSEVVFLRRHFDWNFFMPILISDLQYVGKVGVGTVVISWLIFKLERARNELGQFQFSFMISKFGQVGTIRVGTVTKFLQWFPNLKLGTTGVGTT